MKTAMSATSSMRRLIDILDYIVDERIGIVCYIQDARKEAGAPDFFPLFRQSV
jgi:hypothetical protein